jgi:hypothetical protein
VPGPDDRGAPLRLVGAGHSQSKATSVPDLQNMSCNCQMQAIDAFPSPGINKSGELREYALCI